jgi:hypothetical protein
MSYETDTQRGFVCADGRIGASCSQCNSWGNYPEVDEREERETVCNASIEVVMMVSPIDVSCSTAYVRSCY